MPWAIVVLAVVLVSLGLAGVRVTLVSFVTGLLEEGRPRFGAEREISAADVRKTETALIVFESHYRREFPDTPPPFHPKVALAAATALYRACQLIAFRDLELDWLDADERPLAAARGTPEHHYSIDLTLRFLPSTIAIAAAQARSDPLLSRLWLWGRWRPLSAVGVADVPPPGPEPLAGILSHDGLRTLYIDRIIAHGDEGPLRVPQVADAVRAALGLHGALAPRLAANLRPADDVDFETPLSCKPGPR